MCGCSPGQLEFGSVGFGGEGKIKVLGGKPCRARERTNNKLLKQYMTLCEVYEIIYIWT